MDGVALFFVVLGGAKGVMTGLRGYNYPGAKSPWGRRITAEAPKSPKNCQVFFSIQYIYLLLKDLDSNMGAPNLLHAPGAI